MTRTYPLWGLFAAVIVGCVALARRRRVGRAQLLVAWALSSLLFWGLAGLVGYAGSRVANAIDLGGLGDKRQVLGFMIGASLGGLAGAPLGIALAERWLRKAWPRPPALLLSSAAVALVAAVMLFTLQRLDNAEQQAGKSVLVVFPLLGAAGVLGWLIGERP